MTVQGSIGLLLMGLRVHRPTLECVCVQQCRNVRNTSFVSQTNHRDYRYRFMFPSFSSFPATHACLPCKFTFTWEGKITDFHSVCISCPNLWWSGSREQRIRPRSTSVEPAALPPSSSSLFITHSTQYLHTLFKTSCFIHIQKKVRNHKKMWEGPSTAGGEREREREAVTHRTELQSVSNLQGCARRCRLLVQY